MRLLTLALIISCVIISCQSTDQQKKNQMEMTKLDIQGHRGARGLMPENSIPAFKKALDFRVSTLELDVCVTGDGQLVVSHEPWMSPEICMMTDGSHIPETKNRAINMFQMTYEEIKSYDCGSKHNARFPEQQKMTIHKPILVDMIKEVEAYGNQIGYRNFNYNIEIKSLPEGDNIYHPIPSVFSELVFNTLDSLIGWNRVTIQSFDFRVLQYLHESHPEIRLAALVENTRPWAENIESLGFTPSIYSPYHKLLDKQNVSEMHEKGMAIIPWTVNNLDEMKVLIAFGVDGIITDYPNIAADLTTEE